MKALLAWDPQNARTHQESTKTPTPALSPTLNLVTSAPTAETTPTISWPGTIGYWELPHSSLIWCCGGVVNRREGQR
jgi:hypothetical protein